MLEFDAIIVRLPGKMAWPVFYAPASFATTKSRINVRVVVDGLDARTVLLPSSNGHYLVYTQAMREHGRKVIGDTVHVLLEEDHQPRELEIPHDVSEALDEAIAAKFAALPYYMRREEINKINGAKTQPTREKRIAALLVKLLK